MILYLIFSQILLYFSNNSSLFIKKDIHLVPSKSFLYTLIFGWNMHHKVYFFSIIIGNKIFKIFLTKGALLDTTILLISMLFIKIRLLCWWNLYFLISVSSNFITFYPFLYIVIYKTFYDFFNLKFWGKFIIFLSIVMYALKCFYKFLLFCLNQLFQVNL